MLDGLPEAAQGASARRSRIPAPARRPGRVRRGWSQHIVENPMLNGEVIRLDGALRMAPR